MLEQPHKVYVLDTDSLINVYNHSPQAFKRLRKLAQNGSVRVPSAVIREIKRPEDRLKRSITRWARNYKDFEIKDTDSRFRDWIDEIMRRYGSSYKIGRLQKQGLAAGKSRKRGTDVQVVAAGKFLNAIVVSDDNRIKEVCFLENIECISWTEFMRRVGIVSLFW